MPLEGAIEAYTLNAARQLGRAHRLGSLEAEKRADFIVLDRSPFEIPIYELHKVVPRAVVVGGVVESGSL